MYEDTIYKWESFCLNDCVIQHRWAITTHKTYATSHCEVKILVTKIQNSHKNSKIVYNAVDLQCLTLIVSRRRLKDITNPFRYILSEFFAAQEFFGSWYEFMIPYKTIVHFDKSKTFVKMLKDKSDIYIKLCVFCN